MSLSYGMVSASRISFILQTEQQFCEVLAEVMA